VIGSQHRESDNLGLPLFFPRGVDPSNLRQFGYDHRGAVSISARLRLIAGRAPVKALLPTEAAGQTVFSQPPSTK
jgi:hypothetical protein